MRWMAGVAALACLVAAFPLPVSGAEGPVFTTLGTDPEGDDIDASTGAPAGGLPVGVVVPCPNPPNGDCSSIDDLLGVAVGATATEIVFRLTVKETPEQSALVQGEYCWLAGFQVAGQSEERILMGCLDYQNGSPTPDTTTTTTRGTNLASAAAWVPGQPVFELRAPFSSFGGAVGTQLVDIYGLSYIGKSLNVDDAAPDAKTSRDAPDSLGSYTIGAGAGGGAGPKTTYVVLDGTAVEQAVAHAEPFTGRVQYNWTAPAGKVEIRAGATVGNGTLAITATDAANATLYSKSFSATGTDRAEVTVEEAGTWRIVVEATGFKGNFTLAIAPVEEDASTTTSSSTSGGPASTEVPTSGTSSSATSAGTTSGSKGTPLPWLLVAAALALAAVARRR